MLNLICFNLQPLLALLTTLHTLGILSVNSMAYLPGMVLNVQFLDFLTCLIPSVVHRGTVVDLFVKVRQNLKNLESIQLQSLKEYFASYNSKNTQ